VVAVALAMTGVALATGDPWSTAQKRLHYPVYRPAFTAGLTLASFQIQPCGAGKDGSVFASFGRGSSPNGFGHYRGFMLGEAFPFQCSDFGDASLVGTRTVNGVKAYVFAYCDPSASRCGFADGVALGYVVRWRQPAPTSGSLHKPTLVTMISSKLTFAELQQIAAGLKQVR
jgi:hypothetical protein